jgi:hypothetical protein
MEEISKCRRGGDEEEESLLRNYVSTGAVQQSTIYNNLAPAWSCVYWINKILLLFPSHKHKGHKFRYILVIFGLKYYVTYTYLDLCFDVSDLLGCDNTVGSTNF